jgi:flagellin
MHYAAGASAGVTETYTFAATDSGITQTTAQPTAISYTPSSGTAASYTLTGLSSTSTINDVVDSINKGTGTTGVTASWDTTTHSLVLTGADGDTATSLTGTLTTANTTTSPNGNAGTSTATTATISYTASAGTSLGGTTLTGATTSEAQTAAQSTLTKLNAAITAVSAQDGYIGAQINTLDSVSDVLSTQQENVASAQDAVQATDYASATSDMSKYEILSQTGISALAQANSVQQEVTKLLQ